MLTNRHESILATMSGSISNGSVPLQHRGLSNGGDCGRSHSVNRATFDRLPGPLLSTLGTAKCQEALNPGLAESILS